MATKSAGGGWKANLLAAAGGLAIGAAGVGAWYGFRVPDRAATEQIVREYILNNGEILPEAMERLQSRQASTAVAQNRAALERPFHGAWAGAENGDVVLVQFFDYACGYCRIANPDVERLLREDSRLKVVWREYPVLGPASEQAAIASLAAARTGQFRQFHDRMFGGGRPTPASIATASQAAGVTNASLTPEYRAELQRNFELGRAVGATGTPVFVVGGRVLQGAVGYETLRDAIAAARTQRS